jgi:hypothetical protein
VGWTNPVYLANVSNSSGRRKVSMVAHLPSADTLTNGRRVGPVPAPNEEWPKGATRTTLTS